MNTKKEVVIAPVLQLKKDNYCFRPEVSKLLEENSIDMNELLSLKDIELEKLHNESMFTRSFFDFIFLYRKIANQYG